MQTAQFRKADHYMPDNVYSLRDLRSHFRWFGGSSKLHFANCISLKCFFFFSFQYPT